MNYEKLEISCALLASFFSGRMTQHASVQLKLFDIVLNDTLSKNFNDLCNTILETNKDKKQFKNCGKRGI